MKMRIEFEGADKIKILLNLFERLEKKENEKVDAKSYSNGKIG